MNKQLAAYNSMSDEALMTSLSKGDQLAFNCLYERYAQILKAYFFRMLWKDKEKAEDFVHDLFAKIIQKPELFDNSRTFKTWFFSVANNMCKNEYKKQEVRKDTRNGLDESYAVKDSNADVFEKVKDQLFSQEFDKQLHKLDVKHSEVFTLRHIQHFSIKEIAETLELNEGTVKSRLFYASKFLASQLKEFNPIENR